MSKKIQFLSASIVALSVAFTGVAHAQLDQIVVTATKRETGLQDTPIAITAVSGATLEKQNVDNISELAGFTPNLTFDTTSPVSGLSSGAVIFLRGVGQTDFQLTTDPGVGTYIDGVYVSRSAGGVLDVVDLERVEILRGPQGTLFGRNTIGGAFNLVSKRPDDEFSGKLAVTTGSRNRLDVQGSINIPLSENLRNRFSFSERNQDGYVEGQLDDRALGDVNRLSLRNVAEWEPTDKFSASFVADYSRINEENAASQLVGITVTPPGSPTSFDTFFNQTSNDGGTLETQTIPNVPGLPSLTFLTNAVDSTLPGPLNGVLFDGAFIPTELDQTFATGPNGTELENFGFALTLDLDLGAVQVKSITAYRDSSGSFARDADGSPLAVTHTENFDYDHEQFSQELQFIGESFEGRLQWVGGLYFFNETGNDLLTVTLPQAFGAVNNFTFVDNTSLAAYVQGTYKLTDALSFTGGVRYTNDNKEYLAPQGGAGVTTGLLSAMVFDPDGPGPLSGPPPGTFIEFFPNGINNEETFDNVSYKLGLDYSFENGALVYASWSTGFKSGGFNTRYLVPVPAVVSFDEETLGTAEIGVKWQGFDNRIRTNVAVYYSDYNDIQQIVFVSGAPLTQNVADARIWGFEGEFTAQVFDGLLGSVSAGYTNAEYTSASPVDPGIQLRQQVLIDNEIPNTPEFQLAVSLDYDAQITENLAFIAHGDWRHTSSVQNDAQNSQFLFAPTTEIFNASVGFLVNDRVGVTVFVDNLTDERFITSGDSNFGIGFHEANFNRPREWGVKVAGEF